MDKLTEYNDTTVNYKTVYCLLVLFSLLLFVVTLNSRNLVAGDETRVAGISAQIAEDGNWLKPELNGKDFLEKPPLFFWSAALSMKLFGRTPFAARLPSALMAVFSVLGMFWFLKKLNFTLTGALFSAVILGTSAQFWEYGHKCMIDMMLAVFIEFAVLSFAVLCTAASGREKLLYFLIYTAAVSGALFSKGLVGLAVPAAGIFSYLFIAQFILKKGESWDKWLYFISGAVLAFIPVSVWILFLYRQSGYDAVYTIVWTNNFGRFTGTHAEHVEPFYYYIKKFHVQLAPWTFLLIPAFVYHFFQIKRQKSQLSLYFLCAAVVPYILLSVSAGKRQVYLLPLYAFQSVLIGNMLGALPEYISRSQHKEKIMAALKILGYVLAAAFGVTAVVCLVFGYIHGIRFWLFMPALLLLFSLITLTADMKGNRRYALYLMLISMALLFGSIDSIFIAAAKKKYSYVPLFSYLEKIEKNQTVSLHLLNSHEKMRGAVVFYLGHKLPETDDKGLKQINFRDGKEHLFIFDTGKKKTLPAKFSHFEVVKMFKIGKKYTMILKNKS